MSLQFPLESYGIHVIVGCGISVHTTEHSKLNDERFFVHISYLSCFFPHNIHSFINIHKTGSLLRLCCFQATHLAFQRLQGDDMAFCHCHWWWVGLRPHYNASHRGTVELRKQPSWSSERNSLVCALENRGLVGEFFSCWGRGAKPL